MTHGADVSAITASYHLRPYICVDGTGAARVLRVFVNTAAGEVPIDYTLTRRDAANLIREALPILAG